MLWRLTKGERLDILFAIHHAIAKGLADPTKSEPQLIANIVKELPDALNKISLGSRKSLATGGVFIHASPFVTCENFPEPSPKSVEIGDLLLVRTAIHNNKVQERRALLLQAKKVSKIPTSPDNVNQHHLYANWPSFKYVRTRTKLKGESRHIKGPNLYSGAKYFLIGNDPVAGCCHHPILHLLCPHDDCQLWLAEPSHPKLSAYRCFYQEMLDFIIGNTGRPYEKPSPKSTGGWDRVIEDFLEQTSVKISAYTRRAKTIKGVRGHGVLGLTGVLADMGTLVEYLPNAITSDDGNNYIPPNKVDDLDDNDDGGGISIIEFVANSEGEEYD